MTPEQPVLVTWVDSQFSTGAWEWRENREMVDLGKCRSLGFVLEENDKQLMIAATLGGAEIYGVATIPKCAILSIQKCKFTRERPYRPKEQK